MNMQERQDIAHHSRRRWLAAAGSLTVAATAPSLFADDSGTPEWRPRFCLNTSTIRGQELPLVDEVDLVADAGYDGIEPWIREIQAYVDGGGSLPDLKKRIADRGLTVESAIGFAPWIVDDDARRAEGVEQLKRDMDLVRLIGGTHIAAPPVGAHSGDSAKIDLFTVAERYAAILDVGAEIGVIPQVEIWGPSRNLSRLGEAVLVAVESGHADACVLPDIYHIYRGGSGFEGLGLLSADAVHCLHVNDYPTDRPRTELGDANRVYPGDGDAPVVEIMRMLKLAGFRGALSLELFNRDYWRQDAAEVVRTGIEKMRAAVSAVG
jgi:sugar phosphate isomerase/epimerase